MTPRVGSWNLLAEGGGVGVGGGEGGGAGSLGSGATPGLPLLRSYSMSLFAEFVVLFIAGEWFPLLLHHRPVPVASVELLPT